MKKIVINLEDEDYRKIIEEVDKSETTVTNVYSAIIRGVVVPELSEGKQYTVWISDKGEWPDLESPQYEPLTDEMLEVFKETGIV